MSEKCLESFLGKFRYQGRAHSGLLKSESSAGDDSTKSLSVSPSRRTCGSHTYDISSPSFCSQDSEVTCIPETPSSIVSSPRSPIMTKTKRLATRGHARLVSNHSSDSEDCETRQISKADKSKKKPAVRPQGERKFRLISTGSESSDSEGEDQKSVASADARSSSLTFGASSSCHHNEPQKPEDTGTGAQGSSSLHSFKFNKKLNLANAASRSPIQYTALPSSSESDTDATTLGSHPERDSLKPSGLSDLETPPPTVRRKRKRIRVLSEGQDSIDGSKEEEIDSKQKEDISKLKEMFPEWTIQKLKEELVSADWCIDVASAGIVAHDSDSNNSDHKDSLQGKRVRRKKRRKIEQGTDKENSQQWLSKSKMTSYFPKITRPSQHSNTGTVKRRCPDKDVTSSEDETFSVSSDISQNEKSRKITGRKGGKQAKMNQLILSFFNDATPEGLLSISHCSKVKVKKIVAIRPYEDYDDLITKFESTKGLNTTLIWNCSEVFQSQQVMTTLMNNCAKIADNIQTIVCKQLLADTSGETETKKTEDGQITQQPVLLADKLVLKPYQMIGLNWLALIHKEGVNGILADEMGLGKTVQTIAFLAHLLDQGDGGPHLIVVPSSTMENWVRELHTWCPALDVILYTGSIEERLELRNNILTEYLTCNVIITSYNMCISNADDRSLFRKMGLHYAVFDEAHMLKNMQSQRYKFLMKIRAERKLLLTGTPLQNNLKELISLLSFVMPDMFCDKAEELQKLFSLTKQKSDNPLEQSTFERERIAHARQIMQPFILRRVKSEVLKQLPKKTVNIMRCPMTKHQEECYNTTKATLSRDLRPLGDGTKLKITKLSCAMMQLRKAANHELLMRSHYDDSKLRQMAKLLLKEPTHYDAEPDLIFEDMSVMTDYELHRLCHEYNTLTPFRLSAEVIVASGKFQVLDKMLPDLKEKGDRVLMFSQFVMVLDIIESYMKHHRYRYLRLDGQTPVCDRLALIDKYNSDEEIFVFLLSTRAGGLGINLTAANHVILHDIDYNPYNDKQAEDRCHRVGQKRNVTVTKLISSSSIEEGMLRCAQYKLQLEEQMTTNDNKDGDAENATNIAQLLKDALEL